ncbi:MAG: hypothetical protein ACRDMI_09355 [Streptosporangiaceae bacterium]
MHDRLRALLAYLPRNLNRPRLPSWAIFDEATRRAGPLSRRLGTPNEYAWSPDNSAEPDYGWITGADSPEELAKKIGVEPEVLAGTLSEYNAAARVLRPDGEPIPGLFAAGSVSAIWGYLTDHGGGLTDAIVFGQCAGTEAAARAGRLA